MTEEQGKYEVAATDKKEMGLMLGNNISMFLDTARFEFAQRVAGMFAKSSMVPTHFQNNIGNCMIALNLAERMRVDPFMLMQNLYIVHGRPGIEAKLAIALINGAGRFEPIEFEFEGKGDTRQCRATAKEIKTGKVLQGPWVSWTMAKAERWVDKDGSKWKTMPDLMFMYRSAMFFARVYDPGVLLGLRTKDELDDMVIDVTPQAASTEDLTAKIRGEEKGQAPVEQEPTQKKRGSPAKAEVKEPDPVPQEPEPPKVVICPEDGE